MLVAINLVGVSETFVLGKKAGVNIDMLYDVIKISSGRSWVMEQKFPNMTRDEFSPGFRVWLQDKDLALAMNLASQLSVFIPMASLALQLYESAEANGFDNLDHSAVVKVLQKLSGIPVRE